MAKIKPVVEFETKIDSGMWQNLLIKHSVFRKYDCNDMRPIYTLCYKKSAREYKRDFSFLITKEYNTYIEHIPTGIVFSILWKYNATFKSDGYDIIDAKMLDYDVEAELRALRDDNSDIAIVKLNEFNSNYILDIFVLPSHEYDGIYDNVKYSYFINWFDPEEDDEEDDEDNEDIWDW